MKIQDMRTEMLVVPLEELRKLVEAKFNEENPTTPIKVEGEVNFNVWGQPCFAFRKV